MFVVSVSRNLMLKVSVLGVLCYHWLGRVAADPNIIGLKVKQMIRHQIHFRITAAVLRNTNDLYYLS